MSIWTSRFKRVMVASLAGAVSLTLVTGVFSSVAFADGEDTPAPAQPSDSPDPSSPDPSSPDDTSSPDASSPAPLGLGVQIALQVMLSPLGGSVPAGSQPVFVTVGQPVAGLPAPTWSAHIFLGWFTSAVGGVKVANDDVLAADTLAAMQAVASSGDPNVPDNPLTLFAHWQSARHYTFNANGGSVKVGSMEAALGVALGSLPTPTRSCYIFNGWFTAKTGGTKVTSATKAPTSTGTTTLYAQWKAATIYTFSGNGGTVSSSTKTVAGGSKIGTLPTASRSSYVFAGWYTKASGGSKVTTSTKAPKAAGKKTVYAHWKPATRYNFNANGGTVSTSAKTVAAKAKVGTLPTPTRPYFAFMGWYTASHAGGSHITTTTKAPAKASTVTLYAHWAPTAMYQFDSRWNTKRYSVGTFKDNGCGPSAMSIVVRALASDTSVTPWTAAEWARAHGFEYTTAIPGRTNPQFFIDYPASYGITVTAIPGGSSAAADAAALAAVKSGDWVIAFMSPGNWAVHGHYIVWYDVAGATALVRDPVSISTSRTAGKIALLQKQAWGYYIVHVPANKRVWA